MVSYNKKTKKIFNVLLNSKHNKTHKKNKLLNENKFMTLCNNSYSNLMTKN